MLLVLSSCTFTELFVEFAVTSLGSNKGKENWSDSSNGDDMHRRLRFRLAAVESVDIASLEEVVAALEVAVAVDSLEELQIGDSLTKVELFIIAVGVLLLVVIAFPSGKMQ